MGGAFFSCHQSSRLFSKTGNPKWMKKKGPSSKQETPLQGKSKNKRLNCFAKLQTFGLIL